MQTLCKVCQEINEIPAFTICLECQEYLNGN